MSNPDEPDSHFAAEIEDIVRVLRGYGVLRRARLCELAGGGHWQTYRFQQALQAAVARGRVVSLGNDLYELSERERADG